VVVAESEILGVGRYDRLLDASAAEVAFATRDDHQGLGVARALFAALATAAYSVGITQFVAETLPENHKMLDVFAHTGLVSGRAFGRGVVDVTMSLVDAKGVFRLDRAEREVPSA
jgi:GNAT superfamily N-acetyltransferase